MIDRLFFFFGLLIPFFKIQVPGVKTSPPNILSIVLIVLLTSLLVLGKIKLGKKMYVLIFVLFLYTYIAVRTYFSPVTNEIAVNIIVQFTSRISAFLIPLLFITNKKKYKLASRAILWGGIIVIISTILVGNKIIKLDLVRIHDARFFILDFGLHTPGIIGNFGDIALYSGGMLIALLFPKSFDKNLRPVFILTIAIIWLWGQVYIQSRNVILTTIIALCVIFLIKVSRSNNRLFNFSVLSFFGAFLLLFGTIYFNTIEKIIQNFIDVGAGRITLIQIAIRGIEDKLLFGHGLGAFELKTGYPFSVHNVFFQAQYAGGLIALFFFLMLIFIPIVFAYRYSCFLLNKRYLDPFISLILIIFTASFFFPALNSIVFWYFLGIWSAIPFLGENQVGNNLSKVVY